MFQRLIVPLDGSSRAERAIPAAAHLARFAQGSIVFLRVVVPGHEIGFYGTDPTADAIPSLLSSRCAEAARYLASIATTFHDDLSGIKVETAVEIGSTTSMIISAAGFEHGDLIVLCSHGETGLKRWVFHSVAVQAMRHSPVPVFILNEQGAIRPLDHLTRPLHILVPLDGSTLAESALTPVAQLVAALSPTGNGTLHLLRVVDVPLLNGSMRDQALIDARAREHASTEAQGYLDGIVKRLQEENQGNLQASFTTSVNLGPDVPGTIIQQAGAEHCDMIALATHGRSGLTRLLMGSVAEGVVGHTTLPLFVIRSPNPIVEQQEAHDPMEDEQTVPSWVGLL